MKLGLNEIQLLEATQKVMWTAMLKLRELEGASDLTLHLEASVHELDDLIQAARRPRIVSEKKG